MVLHGDSTANTLLGTDGPVLLEGPGSIDGRLVNTGGDSNIVGTTVSGDLALNLGAATGIVGAIGLDNIVLYKRVAGPSVDGEVAVTLGVEGTTVVDSANQSRQ